MLLSHWDMNAVGHNNCRELAQLIHENLPSSEDVFRVFDVLAKRVLFTPGENRNVARGGAVAAS